MRINNVKKISEFWEVVRTFRNKRGNGRFCDLSSEKILEFYENIFPPRIIINEDYIDVRNRYLDNDITLYELNLTLRKLKANKAPREDGITNEFYKSLPINVKSI